VADGAVALGGEMRIAVGPPFRVAAGVAPLVCAVGELVPAAHAATTSARHAAKRRLMPRTVQPID
jgi:hypothetical protein